MTYFHSQDGFIRLKDCIIHIRSLKMAGIRELTINDQVVLLKDQTIRI